MEPRLGANAEELQVLYRNGIVPYGPSFDNLLATLRRFVQQVGLLVGAGEGSSGGCFGVVWVYMFGAVRVSIEANRAMHA